MREGRGVDGLDSHLLSFVTRVALLACHAKILQELIGDRLGI